MSAWDLGRYEQIAVDGRLDRLRESALGILRSANEDPAAFRVTSPYVVVAAQRK